MTVALFHYHTGSNAETIPSSLVTVSPFSSGGQRRLVLNAQSPLVKSLAAAASSRSAASRAAAALVAEAMLVTASWPTPGLDTAAIIGWMGSGLNCGPQQYYCWVVPFLLYQSETSPLPIVDPKGTSSLDAPTHLMIFPLRIVLEQEIVNKANPGTAPSYLTLPWPLTQTSRDLLLFSRCATHKTDSST